MSKGFYYKRLFVLVGKNKMEGGANISYYNGCKALPIYATPKRGYNKEKIVHILLDPKFDSCYLCTDHPTLVQNNAAFVIDLSKLKAEMMSVLIIWVLGSAQVLGS